MDTHSNLTSILKNHLTFSPHIIGSQILTRDGLCLTSLSVEEEEDFLGAMSAGLMSSARRVASKLLGEHANTVIVKSDHGFVMAVPCGSDLILAVITRQQVALDEMMQTVERIAAMISNAHLNNA